MIRLETNAYNKMVEDAIKSYPEECCGFFYGEENNGERIVKDVLIVDNSKEGDKRRRFEITAQDYIRAENYAEENGIQLLGIYHSHPEHPSIPSETDRQSAQPYFSYIIISIHNRHFNSLQSW